MPDAAETIVREIERAAYEDLVEREQWEVLDHIRTHGYNLRQWPGGVYVFEAGDPPVVVVRCRISPGRPLRRLD